jgi:hypothetical protein
LFLELGDLCRLVAGEDFGDYLVDAELGGRKRLRMSAPIACIDMPAWPPWPWPSASSARSAAA